MKPGQGPSGREDHCCSSSSSHCSADPRPATFGTSEEVLKGNADCDQRQDDTSTFCSAQWHHFHYRSRLQSEGSYPFPEIQIRKGSGQLTLNSLTISGLVCRWCITGTPLSRGLEDLYGLFYFLHAAPYSERHFWHAVLQRPYMAGCPAGGLLWPRLAVSGSHCMPFHAFHLGARLPACRRQGISEVCQQSHVHFHGGTFSGTCMLHDLLIMGYAKQKFDGRLWAALQGRQGLLGALRLVEWGLQCGSLRNSFPRTSRRGERSGRVAEGPRLCTSL